MLVRHASKARTVKPAVPVAELMEAVLSNVESP
jgi:hypothetical protein